MSDRAPSLVESVSQFLYREARLLDDREWDDWLALWMPDAEYRVPTSYVSHAPHEARSGGDRDLTDDAGIWWIDEDAGMLARRIAKLRTRKAWAENPPSRTRRLITNVEVLGTDEARGPEEALVDVTSNFLLYRNRRSSDIELFVGRHEDQLVRRGDSFSIRRRLALLDATLLPGSDLATFL